MLKWNKPGLGFGLDSLGIHVFNKFNKMFKLEFTYKIFKLEKGDECIDAMGQQNIFGHCTNWLTLLDSTVSVP